VALVQLIAAALVPACCGWCLLVWFVSPVAAAVSCACCIVLRTAPSCSSPPSNS
jgi:hypothetical protein